ncbi:hypothetical protein N7470_009060 [Penicillium chermesinum]|nr:hypothetical protein N7470_009060 [Penicillium chermesinum]
MSIPKTLWKTVVSQKREARDRLLAPYLVPDIEQRTPRALKVDERSRLDQAEWNEITDMDNLRMLLHMIQAGLTAENVVQAYIRRAVVAHQLTNCLTEVFFEDALDQARKLDARFQETQKLKGPLHGIPITLKDQFNVKDADTTLGYVGRAFAPAQEDAVLVQILKELGAVIIAKSNLPQSIMWAETENPLWGLTTNARNPALNPGGSSGGEGALLALHGSILGFGTDVGGSVRIPSALAGIYGFKPSSGRFPYEGAPVSLEGQDYVPSVVGPMARDLDTICHITKLVTDARPWDLDPRCTPIFWNEDIFQKIQTRPLVIGLMRDDGVVRVHPPIARVLEELAAVLEADGHECNATVDCFYIADGGEDIRRAVTAGGEPFIPHVEAFTGIGKTFSIYQYWQLNKRKFELQKKYLDRWNAARSSSGKPVDILLSPTLPIRWVGYMKVWNFLDYPALAFPVDQVRADQDRLPAEPYEPRNPYDEWNWNLYDPDQVDGYPVGLQIIGKKLEDEKALGAALVVEKAWKKHLGARA